MLKTLASLGFDQIDAQVYVYLAKKGMQKASDVCKALGLTKQQLYPSIKRLQNKGIVTSIIEHPARFSVMPFEKVLDLSFLIFSVALLLTRMALPDWLIKPSEATALILAVMIPIFLLVAWKNDLFLKLLDRFSFLIPARWREWVIRQAGYGLDSLALLRQPRLLIGPLSWSFAIWVLGFLTNLFVFWAMGLSLTMWPSIFLLVVLQAGVAVPSSPGRIGVFHYLTVLSLALFNIDKVAALGCGVVLHLVVYVPLTLLGAWFLWREKITWSKLAEAAARLRQINGKPS